MSKKLIGGYETYLNSLRIYDLDGELVMADGRKVPCEILELLAIYITTFCEKSGRYKFFPDETNGFTCEYGCLEPIDVFIVGYGRTREEALTDCNRFLDSLKNKAFLTL